MFYSSRADELRAQLYQPKIGNSGSRGARTIFACR